MPYRRALVTGLLASIAILSVDPVWLFTFVTDVGETRRELERLADRSPEFTAFLNDVRRSTQHGDTIVLLLPVSEWKRYTYGYYRASYVLAGRTVLPMITREGEVRQADVARARYLAVFGAPYEGSGVVWRRGEGTLVERR